MPLACGVRFAGLGFRSFGFGSICRGGGDRLRGFGSCISLCRACKRFDGFGRSWGWFAGLNKQVARLGCSVPAVAFVLEV